MLLDYVHPAPLLDCLYELGMFVIENQRRRLGSEGPTDSDRINKLIASPPYTKAEFSMCPASLRYHEYSLTWYDLMLSVTRQGILVYLMYVDVLSIHIVSFRNRLVVGIDSQLMDITLL